MPHATDCFRHFWRVPVQVPPHPECIQRMNRPPNLDLTAAADHGREDELDPKRWHDRRTWHQPRKTGRKAMQLCGQVADALRTILPGLADEVLHNLTVVSVEPAPNTGRLLVTVAGPVPADVTDQATRTERLTTAAGHIRTEVAAAVCRRKAPELVFRVI